MKKQTGTKHNKKNSSSRRREASSKYISNGKTSRKKERLSSRKRPAVSKKKRQIPKKSKRKQRRNLLIELGLSVLIVGLLVCLTAFLTIRVVKVEGYAMTPALNDQDRVLIYKHGQLKRFSLICLTTSSSDNTPIIRRVIGLPGETVYYQNGLLFVNGEEVPERFFSSVQIEGSTEPLTEDFHLRELIKADRIPENSYLVLGDNRPYASDSRSFGLIEKQQIIGVVTARIFPLHDLCQF